MRWKKKAKRIIDEYLGSLKKDFQAEAFTKAIASHHVQEGQISYLPLFFSTKLNWRQSLCYRFRVWRA